MWSFVRDKIEQRCVIKLTLRSVLDIPARDLERKQDRLTRAIAAETRFGVGANFKHRREHDVMDEDWSVSGVTKQNKVRGRNSARAEAEIIFWFVPFQ